MGAPAPDPRNGKKILVTEVSPCRSEVPGRELIDLKFDVPL